MMRLETAFIVVILCLSSCAAKKKSNPVDVLMGDWKIIKVISLDDYSIVDQDSCINKKITFSEDRIINTSSCLYGYDCQNPKYKLTRVNTLAFFDRDKEYIKEIGFHSDSINSVSTSCEHAFFHYVNFVCEDTLVLSADNNAYILAKSE